MKLLVLAAVSGIVAGTAACASRAAQPRPTNAEATATEPSGDRHACGNHDGGACGALDDEKPPARN